MPFNSAHWWSIGLLNPLVHECRAIHYDVDLLTFFCFLFISLIDQRIFNLWFAAGIYFFLKNYPFLVKSAQNCSYLSVLLFKDKPIRSPSRLCPPTLLWNIVETIHSEFYSNVQSQHGLEWHHFVGNTALFLSLLSQYSAPLSSYRIFDCTSGTFLVENGTIVLS